MSQKVVETRKNFITQEAHARHGAVLDVLTNQAWLTTHWGHPLIAVEQ